MNCKLEHDTLYLSGELTIKTLNQTAFQAFQQACQNSIQAIDFSEVTRADSACVSLLLSALRQCKTRPTLRHTPDSVLALAELYEIQNWLIS
ncbi:MAG: STAS domain-containing protein [Neisseria sp.]|nr:STAS domain-containing protein [Neisseria sp.]